MITTVFYFLTIYILSDYSTPMFKKTIQNLYRYAFAQLITIGPIILYNISFSFNIVFLQNPWFGLVANVMLRLSGLVNYLIFMRLGAYKEDNEKSRSIVTIDLSDRSTLGSRCSNLSVVEVA